MRFLLVLVALLATLPPAAASVTYSYATGGAIFGAGTGHATLLGLIGGASVSGTFVYDAGAALSTDPGISTPGGSSLYPDALSHLYGALGGIGTFSDVDGRVFVGDGKGVAPPTFPPADFVFLNAEPGLGLPGAVYDLGSTLALPGYTLVNVRLRWYAEAGGANPSLLTSEALPATLPPAWPFAGQLSLDFVSPGTSGLISAVFALTDVSPVAAIPEPQTYALVLAGLGLLGFAARRRLRGSP